MLPIPQRLRASQPPHEGRGLRGPHNPQGAPKTSWMGLEPSLCQSPAGLVILVEGACSWSGVRKVGPFLSPDSTTSHLHLTTIFFYFFYFFAFPAHCWRVRGAQEHGECLTPSPCPPHCCKAVAVEASPWLWEGCGGERWDQHQYLGEEHNPTASSRAARREQLYWDHLWVLLLVSSLGPFK